jgi:hypothetical protein
MLTKEEMDILNLIKEKYNNNKIDNYEVVVALVTFVEAGKVKKENFKTILYRIFDNDEYLILKSVKTVSKIIDKEFIDDVLGR